MSLPLSGGRLIGSIAYMLEPIIITNVLLIGTDARDLDEASRADSMIIATLDNNNKNIKSLTKNKNSVIIYIAMINAGIV